MLITPMEVLSFENASEIIDGVIAGWFDDNGIPEEYRMSVPFMLFFQKEESLDDVEVSFAIVPIYKIYYENIGNC